MKNIKLTVIVFMLSILIMSCTDHMLGLGEIDLTENIIGKYEGKLFDLDESNNNYDAEVFIERMSNNSIKMSLNCEIMDTAITFDLFENQDSLMVCFNGEDFENHYGHGRSGVQHMMNNNEMYNWMHHLDEDHEFGEMHYGGFDMNMHSFRYEFMDADNRSEYVFEGEKRNN